MIKHRMYHVVAVNDSTGSVTIMTAYAEPHHIACVILSKCGAVAHKNIRYMLQEVI